MPKRKTPYNFPLSHIKCLRAVINDKKMLVPDGFKKNSSKRLQRLYNGIGVERWSPYFRRFVTWLLDFLEAPALIHDVEFSEKVKTYGKFTAANFRLIVNAWKDKRGLAGTVAGLLCQLFGFFAYKAGGRNERL